MDSPIPADDLLARTRRVYADCQTYSDSGEHTTRFSSAPGRPPHTTRLLFQTRWKRPDRFYFEFKKEPIEFLGQPLGGDRFVIWTTLEGPRSWWTIRPRVETHASLDQALGVAAGVSSGTSWFIADLLCGAPSGNGVPTQAAGFWGERKDLDGVPCICVPMLLGPDHTRTLWIDERSALLLRVDSVRRHTRETRIQQAEERLRSLTADRDVDGMTDDQRAMLIEVCQRDASGKDFVGDVREFTANNVTRYRPTIDEHLDDGGFAFEPPSIA